MYESVLLVPPAAPARTAVFDLNVAAQQLVAVRVVLLGWSIRNMSASASAAMDIADAVGGDTQPVFPITLAANESSREWFGPMGIEIQSGIYLNVTVGEIKGSIFFRHPTRTPHDDPVLGYLGS